MPLAEVAGPDPHAQRVAGRTVVYGVTPTTVYAYGREETFSATRWRS
jgi:hypothetical protein